MTQQTQKPADLKTIVSILDGMPEFSHVTQTRFDGLASTGPSFAVYACLSDYGEFDPGYEHAELGLDVDCAFLSYDHTARPDDSLSFVITDKAGEYPESLADEHGDPVNFNLHNLTSDDWPQRFKSEVRNLLKTIKERLS